MSTILGLYRHVSELARMINHMPAMEFYRRRRGRGRPPRRFTSSIAALNDPDRLPEIIAKARQVRTGGKSVLIAWRAENGYPVRTIQRRMRDFLAHASNSKIKELDYGTIYIRERET